MIKLGLTGSIGMGKSTTAQMFRDEQIPVYDADQSVHDLYESEAVGPIGELFPEAIVDNKVDRKILGSIVLGDKEKLKKLEQTIHPLVHQKEKAFLEECRRQNQPLVLLDIPLLFETGGESRVDKTLVVTASAEEQKRRVLARPGMTEEKLASILSRQVPDEIKRQRADFLIDTELGLEHARAEVQKIIRQLTS